MTGRWNQDRHRFADDFLRRIAKNPLRPLVPAGDDAIEVFAHDGIIRGLHYGGEPGARVIGPAFLRDIAKDQHDAKHRPIGQADQLAVEQIRRDRIGQWNLILAHFD